VEPHVVIGGENRYSSINTDSRFCKCRVPLGITKYSPSKFETTIFTGKFIFNEALVWVAILLGRTFIKHLGLPGPGTINITTANSIYLGIGIAAGIAIMAVIIYLSLRIDWAKIIGEWFPWTGISFFQ
jgi:hypothetical protein